MLRLQRKPGESVDLYDAGGRHIGRVVMTKGAMIFKDFDRDAVKILRSECAKQAQHREPALTH